jgi:hypothetical protein
LCAFAIVPTYMPYLFYDIVVIITTMCDKEYKW